MPLPSSAAAGALPFCADTCPLLAEVNHRTANQFAVLTSYIHLSLEESRRHPGEIRDLQLAFAAVEARAGALAALNRQLMQGPSGELVDVSLILHDICAAFGGSDNVTHSVREQIEGAFLVGSGVNVAIGQIVTEALMNALKYAYPDDRPGEVVVRSSATDSGELLIEVRDRGIGRPPASQADDTRGFGVRLMRGLAAQGKIALRFVDAAPGLSVQLVVPCVVKAGDVP